jgi:hypothetical protein
MSRPPVWAQCLDFFGTSLVIEPSPGQLSGNAGLLPIRQFDARIGLTRGFAEALDDPRDPDLTEHTFLEMVRSRVYGILAGYEDQNDHDTLRFDPVFKLVADRSPEDDDLASQPTLSRFENAISIRSLKRLRHVFLDQFIASFDTLPRHLTFDHTWIGIAACATACESPSCLPFPILPADPLDSPLRCLPQLGERGRCAPGAETGHSSVASGLETPNR